MTILVYITYYFKHIQTSNLIKVMHHHRCRKGLWQRLFLIFFIGSRTEAYWGEANSVENRSHRALFCLGSKAPKAIEPDFLLRFWFTRGHMCYLFSIFFFKFDPLLASVLVHSRPYVCFLLRFWYEPRPNMVLF